MYAALACLLCHLPILLAQNASTSAQNATAFALLYGYPLLAFQKLADPYIAANGTNKILHIRSLSTPDETTVVRPNFDTLYSAALVDLSQTDLVLNVPTIPASQLAVFSFLDTFGGNFANLGTSNINLAGRYRIRGPQNGTFQAGVRKNVEGNGSAQYVADVFSPTNYGVFLARWHVTNTNLEALHGYQNLTYFTSANRSYASETPSIESVGTLAISSNKTLSPAEKVLQLLARYAPWNQPQTQAGAEEVRPLLEAAGIANGIYTTPAQQLDLEAANQSALAAATSAGAAQANNVNFNNGWSAPRPGQAGNFNNGTSYAYRTFISTVSYLMLQSPTAVYPKWVNTSAGGVAKPAGSPFNLASDEAIIYTFSRKPVIQEAGFWSLTAYTEQNYLIPNNLRRYEIGDRSNITFPDGTPLYRPGNTTQSDGVFEILVQAADNPPPENWTSNWLPGPAGGGNMTAYLRLYVGSEEMVSGAYEYPTVRSQAAITSEAECNNNTGANGDETNCQGTATSNTTTVSSSIVTSSSTASGPLASAATATASSSAASDRLHFASRTRMTVFVLLVLLYH